VDQAVWLLLGNVLLVSAPEDASNVIVNGESDGVHHFQRAQKGLMHFG
jgi:hypothetical protein